MELKKADRINVEYLDGVPSFSAESLRGIPVFSHIDEDIVRRIAKRFISEEVELGNYLIREGKDPQKFFIVVSGQAARRRARRRAWRLRLPARRCSRRAVR